MTDLDREILKIAVKPELCPETRALVMAAGAIQAGALTLTDAIAILQEEGTPRLNLPSEEGRLMGAELARLTGPCPNACESCAYRLGTIPNQSATTVTDALECTLNGDVFACHVDGKPCRGWLNSREQPQIITQA